MQRDQLNSSQCYEEFNYSRKRINSFFIFSSDALWELHYICCSQQSNGTKGQDGEAADKPPSIYSLPVQRRNGPTEESIVFLDFALES